MPPHVTSRNPVNPPVSIDQANDAERLQHRIDDLAQQVLQARDAVLGAEAELGVTRARVAELEQQVHVRDVEIAELRAGLAAVGRRARSVDAGLAAGQRLARGVLKRASGSVDASSDPTDG